MTLSSFFNLAGFLPLMVLSPVDRIEGDELDSEDATKAPKDDSPKDSNDDDKPDEPENPPEEPPNEPSKDSLDPDGAHEDQESYFPRVEWTTEAQSPNWLGALQNLLSTPTSSLPTRISRACKISSSTSLNITNSLTSALRPFATPSWKTLSKR